MSVYPSNGGSVARPGPSRRGRRSVYARRRAGAILAVLVLVAAVGIAAYFLTRSPGSSAETGGPSSIASAQGSGGSVAAAGTTSTTAIRPNGPPRNLEIVSKPAGAQVAIRLQDQTVLEGTTPFTEPVPSGDITISLTKTGYNKATRPLSLDGEKSVTMWLDPKGLLLQSVYRFKCGSGPKQVVFTRNGKELWVSLLSGLGIEIYDPLTGKKLHNIKLGKYGSVEIIFNKAGTRAYVSQMETASVFEIDTSTHEVLRTFETGGSWTKILLLSRDETTLWASNWVSSDVSQIDLATGKLVHRIPTVAHPRGLYQTEDGGSLYVAGFKNGDLQKIDLATRKGTVVFKKTGGSMRHMVADEKKGLLYVDDLTNHVVWVVDLATDEVKKFADTDQCPNTMGTTPDKKVLFVSCRGKDNPKSYYLPGPEWGSVLVLDAATGETLDAIVGGNQCTGLDVSPDGKLLAFSNLLDNDIRVYAIPSYDTLAAGNGGRAIAHLKDIVKD